jgi:hypothetical protein
MLYHRVLPRMESSVMGSRGNNICLPSSFKKNAGYRDVSRRPVRRICLPRLAFGCEYKDRCIRLVFPSNCRSTAVLPRRKPAILVGPSCR